MKKIVMKKGFTVVELAIVLVIMGIVFAIAAPSISGYVANAQARNCAVLTHNMFSELRNVVNVGRLDVDELDATEDDIGEKIKTVVERYTGAEETAVSTGGGYSITTDKICDNGKHTIKWSFTTTSDTEECVSVSVAIECKCDVHENEDFTYNSDIIFEKPSTDPGGGGGGENPGGGVASGNYSEMMKKLCSEILSRWNTYKSGKLENTINHIYRYISKDPLLSQYFTEQQVKDFMKTDAAAKLESQSGFNEFDIVNTFVGDYLFNTVINPTLTYTDADGNTTVYNYRVRIQGTVRDPAEYVYYVNIDPDQNSKPHPANYAKFLCYRTEINGTFTETWYRYEGSGQLTLTIGKYGISPDTQSEVNKLIDEHPELFKAVQ